MTGAKVYNVRGSTDADCSCCKSWLLHWRLNVKHQSRRTECCVVNCSEPREVGAHVRLHASDQKWYIVPTCRSHNAAQDAMTIESGVEPVRARVDLCNPRRKLGDKQKTE